jgi:hypothetical protein
MTTCSAVAWNASRRMWMRCKADLVLQAVHGWKVDVSEIHYDITTAELYGAYADTFSASGLLHPGPFFP